MKATLTGLLCAAFAALPVFSQAQNVEAVGDTICFVLGQNNAYNVKANDFPANSPLPVILVGDSSCFKLDAESGLLTLTGSTECCGDHKLIYIYQNCDFQNCIGALSIKVKCCKSDCFFVNMEEFPVNSDNVKCAPACENSKSEYSINYDPANTYTWSVTGGTFITGANPAEILVTWGAKGSGSVSLIVTDANNVKTSFQACVDILESPVAGFTAPDSVCLEEPVAFTNTSAGGNDFFWDFGDGNTSAMFAPTHLYTKPGTYKVCLVVTRSNFDPNGNPLCCCSDSICKTVVVDSLQGPNIYCISTLCAKDSTKYWTDAKNCGTYYWSVRDENGMPVAFSGQGTDMIFVHWGAGPFGTVSLYAEGCDDLYCEDTVSVIVPIISATTPVTGSIVVCENSTASYSVQKWISAQYDWQVTGGMILSGQGTHTIVVQWGSAGTGTIDLKYSSDFLGGLPGHDPADCMGTAQLKVEIKPRFGVFVFPTAVCLNSTSVFTATPPSAYNWTITPPVTFTGQGTDMITANWDNGSGNFEVTAVPVDPFKFCNDAVTKIIQVIKVPPPTDIEGPAEICPGGTYTYIAHTTETNINFTWDVTGGTPLSGTGQTIEVTWNASGPYSLSVKQGMTSLPFCMSDPVTLTVKPKLLVDPVAISGPDGCTNSIQNYSAGPPQHPDTKYTWTITPANLGSVFSGQGTPNIQVQWNNAADSADLTLTVELCGDSRTVTKKVQLFDPVKPVITPLTPFCAGGTVTLDAGTGFNPYVWSTSATTQTITVSAPGVYSVTTTDIHGCTATDSYEAVPGPVAEILSESATIFLCTSGPASTTLTARDGPGYTFEWFCNGVSSGNSQTLTHLNTGVPGTFSYTVVVTDMNGCTSASSAVEVQQILCMAGGGTTTNCIPQPHTLTIAATNHMPDCNIVDFAVSASANVTLIGWNFDDPYDNTNLGTLSNASHAYTTVGLHNAVLIASVPDVNGSPCTLIQTVTVSIPLVAAFKSKYVCETVTFTDLSVAAPSTWSWSFASGSPATSSSQNPVVTFPGPGLYSVTLTVGDGAGCQATIVRDVEAGGAPVPVITATPAPFCVDKPVAFTGTGAGIVSWLWDFDDGAINGSQNPFHTYSGPGMYNVFLSVKDAAGCTNGAGLSLTVNPLPPVGVITFAPKLTVCKGETVTLTAPSGPGYTYLWSTMATTQSIAVTQAGEYGVTVTDADGCTMAPDPVTVVVLPLPPAFISGKHFICDAGCIILKAPVSGAYSYQWLDQFNNSVPFETNSLFLACNGNLSLSPFSVSVTDINTGCSAVSDPFPVHLATSPAFTIHISGDACEGSPNTLDVDPVQPNVSYTWSNGATGPSIVVQQAGIYTAIGTDTITGCQGTASATIHPLPDLCIVPAGCYDVCNPDTICGPDGLISYQWNKDGVPIPGATEQCYVVTESGTYSLTGTNSFGCSLTSDTLMLKVIDCSCYGLTVFAQAAGPDSCCWSVSYKNPFSDLFRLVMRTNDADFNFDPGSLSPSLGINSIGANAIDLKNSLGTGTPLPSGTLNNFIAFCLTNLKKTPQDIYFDWYDGQNMLFCSDTLEIKSTLITRTATVYFCPGDPVVINGMTYTGPGTVIDTVPGKSGACDTVVTYVITSLTPAPSNVHITCPANISQTVPVGTSPVVVNYGPPTAGTDCVCPGLAVNMTQGLTSGSAFPKGATNVCYMAKDSCGNTATCCFTVTITEETPCDEKVINCIKFELLDVACDAKGKRTYKIRVTNNCSGKLIYAAFGVPAGVVAVDPPDNSVYTTPDGRDYEVRNPNFSPFYSIRFKSLTDSIGNGESDIFEYTLPTQATAQYYIHAIVRVYPKIFYESYLHCSQPCTPVPKPGNLIPGGNVNNESENRPTGFAGQLSVFPNPTTGVLYADLSDWKGQELTLRIFNSQGRQIRDEVVTARDEAQEVPLPENLPAGLYFLEVLTEAGEKEAARFVVQR